MNPSETPRGVAWIANFEEEEQVAARLLVDGLDLVGQDRLRTDLSELIESLAEKLAQTIALVPVRELAPDQSYYRRSDRNSKPPLLLPTSFPGSEAIVANIATNLRRAEQSSGPFVATPSLPNMRAARCRTVLFIDDFSGSGDRLIKFDKGFRAHPTIKSWLSLKWIQVHVAVFAATERAQARLQSHFGTDHVHVHRICPTFQTRPWTSEEQQAVQALCRKYRSPREHIGPYGYQNSKGLMAFVHSVPNNLPPILWQRRGPRIGRWSSFFQGQTVPTELHGIFGDASPEVRAEESLLRLGQERLARGLWRNAAGGDATRILLVLAALARGRPNMARIMDLTGLGASEVTNVVLACRKWGLIGDGLRLTDAGRAELTHAKSVTLRDEIPPLHGSGEPYYPRCLRVGR